MFTKHTKTAYLKNLEFGQLSGSRHCID